MRGDQCGAIDSHRSGQGIKETCVIVQMRREVLGSMTSRRDQLARKMRESRKDRSHDSVALRHPDGSGDLTRAYQVE